MIAEQLDISIPVVSRVLNGKTDVRASEQTRQRVFEVAQELGYRPSSAARSLATGRTMQIAVLVEEPETSAGYINHRQLEIRGLIDAAARHGYRVVVLPLRRGAQGKQQLEHIISEKLCDGFCLFADSVSEELLGVLARREARCVVVGNVEIGENAPDLRDFVVHVDVDNELYARRSVEYLLSLGHERIVWVQAFGEEDQPHTVRLCAGYAAAMKAAGQTPQFLSWSEDDAALAAFARSGAATAAILGGLGGLMSWVSALRVAGVVLPDEFQLLARLETQELAHLLMSGQKHYVACHVYDPRTVESCAGDVLARWVAGEAPRQRTILVPPLPPGKADTIWEEIKDSTFRSATNDIFALS